MVTDERLRVGSLFTGGGGLDYGLELAGLETIWQVEWDPWNLHLLEHGWAGRWRGVTRYADIREVDFSAVAPVDVLVGGFPCQPVSVAGQRRAQLDDRWLWPEYARAVRELRPRWVVIENVAGLLGPHGGLGDVLGSLAEIGYDAEWTSFPASGLGAPHHRDRVRVRRAPTTRGPAERDPAAATSRRRSRGARCFRRHSSRTRTAGRGRVTVGRTACRRRSGRARCSSRRRGWGTTLMARSCGLASSTVRADESTAMARRCSGRRRWRTRRGSATSDGRTARAKSRATRRWMDRHPARRRPRPNPRRVRQRTRRRPLGL